MEATGDGEDGDEVLMARYAGGDAAAFEALYRRHEPRIWRYLLRNCGDRATAEELLQEVWFAVAREAARYQATARFTTWLFAIAHHRLIDSMRTRRRHVSLDQAADEDAAPVGGSLVDPQQGPEATAMARDGAAVLLRAVERLPADQRHAFLLQVEGDLAVDEVARITGQGFETTKSRLRYARARLREILKEYA